MTAFPIRSSKRSFLNGGLMDSCKYISENTMRHISLHDCCCSRMHWNGSSFILEMEWMEVLASHPDNPFDKAHQSGTGRIILNEAVLESGELIKDDHRTAINTINEIKDFEILDFDEIINDGRFELSLFGDSVGEPEADFIKMKVSYSSSTVMFNDLGEISWFESEEFSNQANIRVY